MAELNSEITELLAQAMRAIQYGHKPAAAAYLNRIIELDPDNMDAWRWLAECMPNQSKRDYCLERAGLSASGFQSRNLATYRSSAVVSQSSLSDEVLEKEEPTLAEKHARKGTLRGQKRAELPPHYHTALPINIDYPPPSSGPRRPQASTRRPEKTLPPIKVRVPRKRRGNITFKGVGISVLAVVICTVVGYILFSTGLTTGHKVWNWIVLQVQNNASDISLLGNETSPTPQSLFDVPAEEPVLATFFPTPGSTPQPAIAEASNSRESAEAPADEQIALVITPEPEVTPETPVVAAEPTVSVPAEPTGFVKGPIVIGHSVKGNNIEVMQFGNGPIERMMVAGIHGGNEWNTTALVDQLIEYLQKNPKAIPADRTLYILRLLNPDGEARGHNLDGRTNERGVDLNRNWDANWTIDWPRDGCWNYRPISAGSGPFSEPETVALHSFLESHKISALINYHSAALGIFAGGQPPEAESVRLAKSIAAVTNYAYPAMDTGCHYTGQFADWLANNGIAAVDLELTNHTDTDFDQNLKTLNVLLKWEPSTGPKSLTELINLAESNPQEPGLLDKVSKFGIQTLNTVNGLVFGTQEEK
jgi:hypothetical protein